MTAFPDSLDGISIRRARTLIASLPRGLLQPLCARRDTERVLGGETYEQFLEGLRDDSGKAVLYEACRLCVWNNGTETGFNVSGSKVDGLDAGAEDVHACMESPAFLSLASEAQVKVAGLYLLLDEGKSDFPEDGVTREAALSLANAVLATLEEGF